MTVSKLFIVQKLNSISGYLAELEELLKFSDEEIKNNSGKMHIAERLFQLIVDASIDINNHFIRELKLKIEEDLQSTFYALSNVKIFSEEFTKKIAPSVGQRNIIVHGYEKLDKNLFMKNLRNGYDNFREYMKYIKEYLDKSEELNKN
ncbi:MAG: DUF86 domain-containing protein [Chloroflexota bacterium]